jgi:hypothetical protein
VQVLRVGLGGISVLTQKAKGRFAVSATYPETTPRTTTGNGLAIAALVCGLVGLFIANVILGPLAIIFGAVAWSKATRGAPRKGMAVAGTILGVVDIALFALILAVASQHGAYWHVG